MALYPTQAGYQRLLGLACHHLGQFVVLEPHDARLFALHADALLKPGHPEQAARSYQKAALLLPERADLHYHLGTAFLQAGQPDRGEDQGYSLLSYHTPVERSLDGRPMPIGAGRIVYFKHTPLGQVIEASDPLEATVLLLPEPAVGVGSEWKVTQHHFPAGRSQPIEVTSLYRVNSIEDDLVTLVFDSDEVRYQGDTAATEGNLYTLVGKGRFTFDLAAGCLVTLDTESTMTSKEDDLLLEVVALHSMHLSA